MFVASTRKGERGAASETSSDGSAVHFSLVTISVPPTHQPGAIERPGLGSQNVNYHFVVTARRTLDDDGLVNEVATHLSGRIGSNRDVLLFVHGFNTSFDEARFRLAQIVNDAKFGGVPVLYTWASRGSVFAYGSDRETAMASRDGLERLMLTLAHEPDVGKVHILAHSMGAWMAMEALRENAIAGHPDLDGHLGEVMLASPDIDASVFRQQMARLGSAAHVSILVANNDKALSVSSLLANDRPRVGALDPNNPDDRAMIQGLGVSVRDMSRESVGFIGHGTYANAPDVIASIGAQLALARPEDKNVQAVIDARGEAPIISAPLAPDASAPLVPASATRGTGAPTSQLGTSQLGTSQQGATPAGAVQPGTVATPANMPAAKPVVDPGAGAPQSAVPTP
ncbi:alpha/beta hydrolase [Lichenihabitans sp. PAMC28606]|uniref:alpha/beta hydrolase n=1 Tax=Lichenihabitans sp. PAMC28606 TaxID=2880932 RepID=UPI001D0AFB0E|nr:alpha/beta fold hydrolase [Lichenihabitans sp. PAMC28606]UDL94847.1 alpha/beta hydrolase [Lichenihabitans sp. PAMC28606]